MASHHLIMFGCYLHCGSEDIIFIVAKEHDSTFVSTSMKYNRFWSYVFTTAADGRHAKNNPVCSENVFQRNEKKSVATMVKTFFLKLAPCQM